MEVVPSPVHPAVAMKRRSLFLLLAATLLAPARSQSLPDAPARYDADALAPAFHQQRRDLVKAALPSNGVAVFFSAPTRQRENDVDFEYRQDSYLYYLTGTHEPETVLVLAPGGLTIDGAQVTELLLVPPRNAMSEVWVGRRLGAERAMRELGVQKAVSNERYEELLAPLLQDPALRFFHLPLPGAVEEQGGLGTQLKLFTTWQPPLIADGNWMVRYATNALLSTSSEAQFQQVQPMVKGRVSAETFDGSPLKAAYEAFTTAPSYEAWLTWRKDHLDAKHPDGTMLAQTLNWMRMVKTPEELVLLRRAIDISVLAHREAMKSIEPEMYEYEVEALAEYVFQRNGAAFAGYPSIVGSGENSTILHYNTNRRQMQGNDLVVMDMGAEYLGYTADVTRTVPVDGVFSPEEKAIYELVLQAQEAGIEAARAGNAFGAPGQAAWRIISDGLRALGLVKTDDDVRNFFMHGTSHYLGLWVHDVGDGQPFVPGTVITVEPGIYIRPSTGVDPKWWNIGVRIEDDILITDGDPVNLSAAAPRTVAAIEALMREQGLGNVAGSTLPRSDNTGER